MLKIKRIYEKPDKNDGARILVDRLWPRGMTKEKADIDLWLKELGPSTELRKWFAHDPAKWQAFKSKYKKELKDKKDLLDQIKNYEKKGPVTLLYGARDTGHNEAIVLQEYLKKVK